MVETMARKLTTPQRMYLRRIRKQRMALAQMIRELRRERSKLPTARLMARELRVSYKTVMEAIHG
jgi:hypothetical protein